MGDRLTIAAGTTAVVITASAVYVWLQRERLPLPPGPSRLFILGNFFNFPKTKWYDNFWKLFDKYGDIVYMEVFGQKTIILGSIEAADELLNKRAGNTSRREESYMRQEILNLKWRLTMLQPGPAHQEQRKLLRSVIGPQQLPKHDPTVDAQILKLLVNLNDVKGEPSRAIANPIGAVVVQITYGKDMWEEHGQELVQLNIESMGILGKAMPQLWMVDYIPILRFVPSWFPGATFQKLGIRVTALQNQIRGKPFQYALDAFYSKGPNGSLASDMIEANGESEYARDVLGVLYSVGVETTTSVIVNFLYAMFLYPDIFAKVQAELDAVIGGGRLPTASDRARLVYTDAAWKESLRWSVAVPMGGVPHVSSEDDTYRGMRIPKGTTFIAHFGYILRDPKVYHKPEEYKPERWLSDETLPDPATIMFGYGTRFCPGKYFASRMGFAIIAAIGSLYNIVPLEGEQRPVVPEYGDGGLRTPKGFKCQFIPRSEAARAFLSSFTV